MASSIDISSSSLLHALLILLFITSSSSSTNVLFSDVCSNDESSTFCFEVLNSIPGAFTSENLETLATTTFNFAISTGEDAYRYIDSQMRSTLDPQLRTAYNSCRGNYEQVVGVLEDAQKKWEAEEYEFVVVEVGGAEADIRYCDYNFAMPPRPVRAPVVEKGPAVEPPEIIEKNKYFRMLCHILYLIANKVQFS